MAEYLPIYKPGQALTLKASAAVTAGQVVEVTGVGTVGPAGADSVKFVGVAAFDAAINDNVTTYAGGVQFPIASGTVTAGDIIVCAADGEVITDATPTSAQCVVGIALSTATDAAVRVAFVR